MRDHEKANAQLDILSSKLWEEIQISFRINPCFKAKNFIMLNLEKDHR